MIPTFTNKGFLPPGIHWSTIDEIKKILCFSDKRIKLLQGFELAISSLKKAGCETVYIDGSFASEKTEPGDIDVCWELKNVDLGLLMSIEPVFFNPFDGRKEQKAKFGCEFFFSDWVAASPPDILFLDFFQEDRNGNKKGIIGLKL
ncbi:MAG: hypothetical protein QM710_01620 [Flavobacterium sp.]